MGKTAIVTDSGSGLVGPELAYLAQAEGFVIVPMPVTIAGQSHRDQGLPLDQAITLAHALGEQVLTSSPSPGAFEQVYRELAAAGYESIISLHLASELSATVASARIAARQMDIAVYVLDSKTVGMAYGHVALAIHRLAHRGIAAQRLAAIALEMCENTELLFMIPSLDALRRGGRVHPALARVGQLLQIRPVGTISDGRLIYLERPRSSQRALEVLAERVAAESQRRRRELAQMESADTPSPEGAILAVQYCGQADQAASFAGQFGAASKGAALLPLPAVLSAHTGPGALAAVIY